MSTSNQIIYALDQIEKPVSTVLELFNKCSVFTFTGVLGAGKTTLIQEILRACGVTEVVVSPTFMYMIEYTNSRGENFYHFDLYRMNKLQEFQEAGFIDYLYQPKSHAFIEWPEIIMPLLDRKACYISLDYYGETGRIMTYSFSSDLA